MEGMPVRSVMRGTLASEETGISTSAPAGHHALIPRGRRPCHPSLGGTEDPRDVAKQNGSAAGGTRVATLPEGAGTECNRERNRLGGIVEASAWRSSLLRAQR